MQCQGFRVYWKCLDTRVSSPSKKSYGVILFRIFSNYQQFQYSKKIGAGLQSYKFNNAHQKLLAQVLSNDIREEIHGATDGYQFAFVNDRNIKCTLIANGSVEDNHRNKKTRTPSWIQKKPMITPTRISWIISQLAKVLEASGDLGFMVALSLLIFPS